MSHISINMEDMPIEVIESTAINPLISKCQIKVCYVGNEPNRNRSVITKDVAREMAPTLRGCGIVGYFDENKGDFEEHNRIIDISNGKFQIKDTTRPYGFVPTDAKVWFQWFEDDGVPHEYLMTEGYLWTGMYPECQRVIDEGNNQSMELDPQTLNAYWTKDTNGKPKFFIINEAIISKLCILGEDCEPCFEGASITNIQFSLEDSFKEKMFSMIEKMQEILSKDEGGTPVFNTYAVEIGGVLWEAIYEYIYKEFGLDEDYQLMYTIDGIYEDNNQKFAILRNRKDLTYYRLNFMLTESEGFLPAESLVQVTPDYKPAEVAQFALEDVAAYETTFIDSKREELKDPKPAAEIESVADPAPVIEHSVEPVEQVVTEPVVEVEAIEEPAPVTEHSVEPVEQVAEEEIAEPEPVVNHAQENESAPVANEENKYNLDEVVEYQELLEKYSNLESKVNELNATIEQFNSQVEELNATIANLTTENNELAEFKHTIDREKKQELIDSFYMLSDELKKDCVDNIDTYSFDDIEAKLSVICVRNKVSFDLNKPEENKETVFNLNSVEEDNSFGLPAWVQRVQAVAKEKNI